MFHFLEAEKGESGLRHPYPNSVPGQNVVCQHPLAFSSKCAMLDIIFLFRINEKRDPANHVNGETVFPKIVRLSLDIVVISLSKMPQGYGLFNFGVRRHRRMFSPV